MTDKPNGPSSGETDDRFAPADVEVRREEGVTITFLDGVAVDFNLMELRLACPCATCRSERDKGKSPWPTPSSPTPLRISEAELHGGWGLRLVWNDGHGTGIFPFDSLRAWADQHQDRFGATVGRDVVSPEPGNAGSAGAPPGRAETNPERFAAKKAEPPSVI